MRAGELGASEERPRPPRDARRQWRDDDASVGKEVVDRRVSRAAAAHLREHWGWYANESLLFVSYREDGARSEGEG